MYSIVELIHEVPEYVNLVNGEYFAESVLSAEGKKKLGKTVWHRLWPHMALAKNFIYLLRNLGAMMKKKQIHTDKLLWRIMSDSGMVLKKHYDMAIAYLEGGATYFVHDHVDADQKLVSSQWIALCGLHKSTGSGLLSGF